MCPFLPIGLWSPLWKLVDFVKGAHVSRHLAMGEEVVQKMQIVVGQRIE
jgi:hypothetical protein